MVARALPVEAVRGTAGGHAASVGRAQREDSSRADEPTHLVENEVEPIEVLDHVPQRDELEAFDPERRLRIERDDAVADGRVAELLAYVVDGARGHVDAVRREPAVGGRLEKRTVGAAYVEHRAAGGGAGLESGLQPPRAHPVDVLEVFEVGPAVLGLVLGHEIRFVVALLVAAETFEVSNAAHRAGEVALLTIAPHRRPEGTRVRRAPSSRRDGQIYNQLCVRRRRVAAVDA